MALSQICRRSRSPGRSVVVRAETHDAVETVPQQLERAVRRVPGDQLGAGYAILPRWVSWFGYVAGVAAIFSVVFFTMIVWLLWVAFASVSLFLQSRPATAARREPSAATS